MHVTSPRRPWRRTAPRRSTALPDPHRHRVQPGSPPSPRRPPARQPKHALPQGESETPPHRSTRPVPAATSPRPGSVRPDTTHPVTTRRSTPPVRRRWRTHRGTNCRRRRSDADPRSIRRRRGQLRPLQRHPPALPSAPRAIGLPRCAMSLGRRARHCSTHAAYDRAS